MIYNANKLVPVEMAITSCVEQAIQPFVNELVTELLDDRMKMLLRAQVTRILEDMDLTRILPKVDKVEKTETKTVKTEPVVKEVKVSKVDKLHTKKKAVLTPEENTPNPTGECTLDDILNSCVNSTAVTQTPDIIIPVPEPDTSNCVSPDDL